MFDVAVIIIIMYKSGIIIVFIPLNTVLSNIKYVIDNKIIGIEINNDFLFSIFPFNNFIVIYNNGIANNIAEIPTLCLLNKIYCHIDKNNAPINNSI